MFSDRPDGNLFVFNDEEELKDFVILISPTIEQVYGMGLVVNEIEVDGEEEYMVEDAPDEAKIYPVFAPNPYFTIDEQNSRCGKNRILYSREGLSVNTDIIDEFPLVMYLNIQQTFDRTGDVEIFICDLKPLHKLQTVADIRGTIDTYKDVWDRNLEERMSAYTTKGRQET